MASHYLIVLNDNTMGAGGKPESGHTRFTIRQMTAANFDDTFIKTAALRAAVGGITGGVIAQVETMADITFLSRGAAESNLVQRENKWLCSYEDAVTHKLGTYTIPTADLAQIVSGTEYLNLLGGAGLAFKTAFEAIIVAPVTGNAVLLGSVKYVGRKS